MAKSRLTYFGVAASIVLFLGLAAFYSLCYQYHFYWHEQNQLFLLDSEWVGHYFDQPAWLGCLVGDFLTQFFYYKYAGPVILGAVISLTVWLSGRCMAGILPRVATGVLAVAVGLWCVACSLASTFTLSSTLCILGGFLSFLALRRLGLWGALAIPLVYWLFGFGSVFMTGCYVLMALTSRTRPSFCTALLALAMAFLTPLCLKACYTLHYVQALVYPGVGNPKWPEMDFEHTLAVENEYYFGDYERAVSLALDKDPQNVVTAFYYYLAQAKRDSLPDHLLDYGLKDLGTLNVIGETTPRPVINMMNDLYYELGDMMYAERAAMMRNVFSPVNRNVRMVKRLAQTNLASGDTLAAKKYLRLLSKTHAYAGWASHFLAPDGALTAQAQASRRTNINTMDTVRLGDNCRTILLELLASDPDNTMALDYLLCTDLLLKQIDTFKADYDAFCMARGRQRLRPLYQQALMIYLAGTDAPAEQWEAYIHSPELLRRFRAYSARRGDPGFADTYWYYFDKTK